jgi:DNA-binding MarR family transcriptional regulator
MQKQFEAGTAEPFSELDNAGRYTIAAGRLLERAGSERFRRYGLTISDVAPLIRLVQIGPMTAGELLQSMVLLTSAPVVSHSVNRLEKAGLAKRRPHESDARKVVIEATPDGRRFARELRREIEELQADFFEPLTKDELNQLENMLQRCLKEQS